MSGARPNGARKRLRRTLRRPRWGNLRRLEPVSDRFGFDRGTPIDRAYMDRFFAEHAAAITGTVGEIAEDRYATRFGGDRVERVEIIDLAPTERSTIVGDISDPGVLGSGAFDCLILTQMLQYLPDPALALRRCGTALRPGGTLLLATPALTAHDAREPDEADHWRFWPAGIRALAAGAIPDAEVGVRAYGNVLAAIAFLHGLASEELTDAELQHDDARYPVVVCASITRKTG